MRPFIVILLVLTALVSAWSLPEPATGGKDGKPISLLFLSGSLSMADGLDPVVARQLTARGYTFQVVDNREPLTAEFLRQFNSVILYAMDDYTGGTYYSPGGVLLTNTAHNIRLLQAYVSDGGGLIIVPCMYGAGSQIAETYNEAFAPWKLQIGWETVRDDAHRIALPNMEYAWTRHITPHPVTAGVQALLYATGIMRWDDAYPTVPLLLGDPAWQPLVRGEATSRGMRSVGSGKWVDGEAGVAPVLAAVRAAGKGRVAAVSPASYYLLTHAYLDADHISENTTGPLRGILYAKGDGTTPSDWGILFDNLLRWTAEPGVVVGMGGTPQLWQNQHVQDRLPDTPTPDFAVIDWKTAVPPPTWAHHTPTIRYWRGQPFYDEIPDPMITHPQQMRKVFIGARSAYSDGKGTVAEWAKAAKAAGFSLLVFTERFENFDPAHWTKFVNECQANSGTDFACLQGIDIADIHDNRLLILGNTNFPSAGMLTPDGKRLEQTARLSLGFSQHIAVIHRPGNNPSLPTELFRHFQGVSVYTYADVKQANGRSRYGLADDGFSAYQWQLYNSSNPVPIVVHELTDPRRVATDGLQGFQLVVPSQDVQDARRYFRYGLSHYFEDPQRYFITEGPVITGWSILSKDVGYPQYNRDHFRAQVGVASADRTPIKEVVLYDRGAVVRRWTPRTASFSTFVDGEQGYQHYYMLVATDSKGRRAISPQLRTVTRGYFSRCADRQNFYGSACQYIGIWPSGTDHVAYIDPVYPAPADPEVFGGGPHPLASKLSFPFASTPVTITRTVVDSRYPTAVRYGFDAWRIENVEPSRTYSAWALISKWHDIPSGVTRSGGNLATLTGVETAMRARQAVAPTRPVFPIINNLRFTDNVYVYRNGDKVVEGKLDGRGDSYVDLPAGASIGDYLLLAPMRVTGNGEIGWPAEVGKLVPVGTEWRTQYLHIPRALRGCFGVDGPTPWSLHLTQGTVSSVLGYVNLAAERYGVTGQLQAGGEIPVLPLRISGVRENWPAAVWTPGKFLLAHAAGVLKAVPTNMAEVELFPASQTGTFLNHFGVFEKIGYAELDNSADTSFYAGNTLLATNPALNLAYTWWTKTAAGIEINNPTGKAITARISSPAVISDRYHVDTAVTVPAGSTLRIALPAVKR